MALAVPLPALLGTPLTLHQAVRRIWPVAVIGAGPAGAFLARQLACAGVEVLLIDRASFPRWKVCGCCLNGAALALLGRAGLGDLVPSRSAVPLRRLHLAARGCSADVALPAGAALSRESFDMALIEAAIEAGTAFLPETAARLLPREDRKPRQLRLRQASEETTLSARIVVAADGLAGQSLAGEPGHQFASRPGSRIGAGAVSDHGPDWFQRGTIYMACGPGGYVGVVRLEDGRLDFAAALDPAHIRRQGGLGQAAAVILAGTRWPGADAASSLSWRGTPPLTRQATVPAGERTFLVGDAAGYVEPFTGEGMAWALASAAALAPLVERSIDGWRPEFISQWARQLHRLLGWRRSLCRLLTGCLRRPLLASCLVRLLRAAPYAARPFLAGLNRPPVVRLAIPYPRSTAVPS